MAAIAAVMELLPVPGRVVVAGDAYNGTRRFLADVAGRGRLRFRTVDVADTAATLAACAEMVDAPARPVGRPRQFGERRPAVAGVADQPAAGRGGPRALIEGAHQLGMDVAVDNTFATPLLQRPLELGADVVVHSATKLLAGHSDVVLGAAVTRRPDVLDEPGHPAVACTGPSPGPGKPGWPSRGVRTLAVRLDRAQANAGELARRLAGAPAGRAGSATRAGRSSRATTWPARQMRGFGTMVAFEVAAGRAAAEAVVAAVRLATAGTSLGGVETLIERRGRWAGEDGPPARAARACRSASRTSRTSGRTSTPPSRAVGRLGTGSRSRAARRGRSTGASPARPPAVALVPARSMPVAAQIRARRGHHHQMAEPGRDLLLAARAHVGLAGLERVDLADVDLGRSRVMGSRTVPDRSTARLLCDPVA